VARNTLSIVPLTSDRWSDFEQLFGENGACAGCWCMWPRMGQTAWMAEKGTGTKKKMKAIVKKGPAPGLLAYANGEPVGWCALAPREHYSRLARSRIFAPIDDEAVWSITCFFVRRDWRRRGVTTALLKEAARWVGTQGGRLLEGYPFDTDKDQPDTFVHYGLMPAFVKAGFREVARRSTHRPIMRRKAALR
jgi:GNAT superfamily N-acetyltransferase